MNKRLWVWLHPKQRISKIGYSLRTGMLFSLFLPMIWGLLTVSPNVKKSSHIDLNMVSTTNLLAAPPATCDNIPLDIPIQKTNWTTDATLPGTPKNTTVIPDICLQPYSGNQCLVAVELCILGKVEGDLKYESLDASPTTVDLTLQANLDIWFQGDNICSLSPSSSVTDDATLFDGVIDFGGGSGGSFLNLTGQSTCTALIDDPVKLAPFLGGSPVCVDALALGSSSASGPGNIIQQFRTEAGVGIVPTFYTFGVTGNVTKPSCVGEDDGAINITVTTTNFTYNAADFTFKWTKTGDAGFMKTTEDVSGLTAGTYNVEVKYKGKSFCSFPFTVSDPTPVSCSFSNVKNVSCNGGSNGSFKVTGSGGTSPYMYKLGSGTFQTSGDFTGLTAGNYTVTVKDANGCESTCMQTITEPTALGCMFESKSDVSCFGGNDGMLDVKGTGGTPFTSGKPYRYKLNNGSFENNDGKFTGLSAGDYTVTVKDKNDCTVACAVITIGQPTEISVSCGKMDPACSGVDNGKITVTASGGTGTLEYKLGNGAYQASNMFTGLAAGTYTVTVKDANGCTKTCMTTLNNTTSISLDCSTTPATCQGQNNGTMSGTVSGGTGPYTYSLDGNTFLANGGSFTGLAPGEYTMTVKDKNGCTATCTKTVGQLTALSCSLTAKDVSCKGGNDGELTVTPSGGTSPYEYSKDGGNTFQSSNVFTGLIAGDYTITVKDKNGCTSTCTKKVNQPEALTCSTSVKNVKCNGDKTGEITVTATGGNGGKMYSLDNNTFKSDNKFTGLGAGNYTVYVKDNKGCTTTCTAEITEPTAITCSSVAQTTSCAGGGDGKITTSASGGVGPYMYKLVKLPGGELVRPFQTSNEFLNLPSGQYDVVVKDANGCETTCDPTIGIEVPEPVAFTCNVTPTPATCNGFSDGKLTVSITSGGGAEFAPFEYKLDNGAYQASNMFSGLAAGTYTVTVKNKNGCTTTCMATINQPQPLDFTADLDCDMQSDGKVAVVLNISGGTGPYRYQLNGGTVQSVPGDNTIYLDEGTTPTVKIFDSKNCSEQKQVSAVCCVNEPSDLEDITPMVINGNPNCCDVGGTGGFKIDIPLAPNGTYMVGSNGTEVITCQGQPTPKLTGITFTISNSNGITFDWSVSGANIVIKKVIVKGGSNANVYDYGAGVTADKGLHAPLNGTPQCYSEVSHVEFCVEILCNFEATCKLSSDEQVLEGCNENVVPAPFTNINDVFKDVTTKPCGTLVMKSSDSKSGTLCPNGILVTRTYILFDDLNNNQQKDNGEESATCVQKFRIKDTTKPTVSGTLTGCFKTEQAAKDAALAATTATDACDQDVSKSATVTSLGACMFKVKVTATDDCNNSDFKEYTVKIDGTAPTFTVPADKTVYRDKDCDYEISPTTTGDVTDEADNCDAGLNATYKDSEPVGDNCETVITRTWELKDECGNTTTKTQKITIKDNTAPQVTKGTIESCYKSVTDAENAAKTATSATDNCTATVNLVKTAKTTGTCSATITVTVKDACGNEDFVTYNTRIDNEKPVATKGEIGNCYETKELAEAAAKAATTWTDNCSSSTYLESQETVSSTGSCSVTITVSTKDECGNPQSITYDMNISVGNQAPVATKGTIASCYATKEDAEKAAKDATTWTDDCSTPEFLESQETASTDGTCSATITVKTKDACGKESSVTYTTRIDNTAPTATKGEIASCYATKEEAEAAAKAATTWSDNCSSSTYLESQEAASTQGDCNAVITVSTKDECGNAKSVTYNTRIDNTAPTFTVPADKTIYRDANCEYNANPSNTGDVTDEKDNCDTELDATYTDQTSGDYCKTTITRTWKLVDGCGNTTTKVQTITVEDKMAPTFTVPANKTIYVDANCAYNADPSVTGRPTNVKDNCDPNPVVTSSDVVEEGSCQGERIITRTWKVKDRCNNETVKTQVITVKDKIAPSFNLGSNKITARLYMSEHPEAICPAGKSISLKVDKQKPITMGTGTVKFLFNGIELETPNAAVTDNCTASKDLRMFVWKIEESRTNGNTCWISYDVTYRLFDDCGNHKDILVVYRLDDDVAPTFTGTQPANKTIEYPGSDKLVEAEINKWISDILALPYGDNCSATVGIWAKPMGVTGVSPKACYQYVIKMVDDCDNMAVIPIEFCTTQGILSLNGSSNVGKTEQSTKQSVLLPTDVKVYPNPAKEAVNIDLSAFMSKAVNIRIVNALGQTMEEVKIDEVQHQVEQIFLSNYKEGIYFVVIKAEGYEAMTKRLVIQQR